MSTKVLYISYDGMTDPLGQSQVLPYIVGLSKLGYEFTLLSAEKPDKYERFKKDILEITEKNGIKWETIPFTKDLPIISKIKDLNHLKRKAVELYRKEKFSLIHCRSYVSVEVGLLLKKKFGTRYLFDMRGFWVDERVDGGIWNKKNPVYAFAYRYYKKKELEFLQNADHIISLTNAGKVELETWKDRGNSAISVIPCTADFETFQINNKEVKESSRRELGLGMDEFVISYLGSIGTWYMLDEMLDFFALLLKQKEAAKFLFITPEMPDHILDLAESKGIPRESFVIRFAKRKQVNYFMSASDVSIFFIKPCYSKISSSPTKQGEIMAMGIPLITNSGIGDVREIVKQGKNGIVIDRFDESSYQEVIDALQDLLEADPAVIRNDADKHYNLESGISKYEEVYKNILGANNE